MKYASSVLVLLAVAVCGGAMLSVPQEAGLPWAGAPAMRGATAGAFGDTVFAFSLPATWPTGIAWDGEFFWNQDHDSVRIYKIDTTGQVVRSWPEPAGMDGSGDLEWVNGHLWGVSEGAATLFEFDTLTGTALKSFKLPDSASADPNSWGLTWDGAHFWHTQYGSVARTFEIDSADGHVLYSYPSPSTATLGIAWDGRYLWCVDPLLHSVYVMNPADSSEVALYDWPVPYPLGLKWVGENMWNVSSATRAGGNVCLYKLTGFTAVAEPATAPVPVLWPAPTVLRAVSGVLFDASGRRVSKPRSGVYFVRERTAGGVALRPVVVVR
jgi:hypothetical protein